MKRLWLFLCIVGCSAYAANTADEQEKCAICWEPVFGCKDGNTILEASELPCHHRFHSRCINQWLAAPNVYGDSRDKRCPLCRAPINYYNIRRIVQPGILMGRGAHKTVGLSVALKSAIIKLKATNTRIKKLRTQRKPHRAKARKALVQAVRERAKLMATVKNIKRALSRQHVRKTKRNKRRVIKRHVSKKRSAKKSHHKVR